LIKIKISSESQHSFSFPLIGYIGYGITKFFNAFKKFSLLLDKLETMSLGSNVKDIIIDKPIFITGLARAGTTIVLEMLSKHPDLATHKYKHLLMPYLPFWTSKIVKRLNIYTTPFERIHMDGILITHESPEAVEEMFWQTFFKDLHNDQVSNEIQVTNSNPQFEEFYKNHIRKLIMEQNSSRYLAKNNYLLSRLQYLHKIFPDAKFLMIIRNPVNHIASLIKQTDLFRNIEHIAPILQDWLKITGHYEFGYQQNCINVGNTELIDEIHRSWQSKKTRVEGWACYWSLVYNYIMNVLESDEELRKATLVVKYEELCKKPSQVIDQILEHLELSSRNFSDIKNYYVKHLHEPTYYKPNFSKVDLLNIQEITNRTVARY
jgi:hypothetical protein